MLVTRWFGVRRRWSSRTMARQKGAAMLREAASSEVIPMTRRSAPSA